MLFLPNGFSECKEDYMTLAYRVYSSVGNREVNEDSVGEIESENGHSFIVADGLGGHGHGEVASALAVESGLGIFAEGNDTNALEKSFLLAQKRVMEEQENNPMISDMKTTMVNLIITGNIAQWGHVGDSRLYYFKNGKVKRRTLDHSVPQMLVNLGEIKEKEIRGHEDRNRLLRVIGTPWEKNAFEISKETTIKPGDAFLLCTDGFWELIEEKMMMKYLKSADTVDEWMEWMVEEVNRNGETVNMDNNTAIAIWVTK